MSTQCVAPSVCSGGRRTRPVFGAGATAGPITQPSRLIMESPIAARFELCSLLLFVLVLQVESPLQLV